MNVNEGLTERGKKTLRTEPATTKKSPLKREMTEYSKMGKGGLDVCKCLVFEYISSARETETEMERARERRTVVPIVRSGTRI